ncbi:MAG: hypothetical protein K9N06_04065 [Candidatus Cloacimonetes bacterium]|nr:hypothetical protein [Candidatus Cloacimonadota bacterium]
MEEIKSLLSTLAKEKNNIQSILASLRSLEKVMEFPENNLHKIKIEVEKVTKKLTTSSLIDPLKEEIASTIQNYQEQIPDWEIKAKKMFFEELENVLAEAGFTLRGDSSRLMVSVFTLELDLDNLKVIIWYGNKQENVVSCRLNPAAVVTKLAAAQKKIMEREFDSETFLAQLFSAYKAASERQIGKDKTRVPISDVLKEFVYLIQPKKFYLNPSKNNFLGYERTFFSFDMFRLPERVIEGYELNLITATRAYTKNRTNFLWIPTDLLGNGDYISHITFKEI